MHKYRNEKVIVDGISFDSKKEAARYRELKMLERSGAISGLKMQVPFELIPKQSGERACIYKADFVYYQQGKKIVEDTKGFKTDVYKIKRKLMLYRYGIKIKES